MKRLNVSLVLLAMVAVTTGCWSNREVHDITYPSAIGVDYQDGDYIVYLQILDFSSVAKLEGQQKKTEAPVWVGKGAGKSFTEAANRLYRTSQQLVTWGHVEAIVFSESMLRDNRYQEVLELVNRYREIRYLIWAFSTKEPIDELFNVIPFFRLSPKSSILNNPEEIYRQRSLIRPIRLYQFIMLMKEKALAAYLPCLTINRDQWMESGRNHSLLEYNGLDLFQSQRYMGQMKVTDLEGLPWMREDTVRMPLPIGEEDKPAAVLVLENPNIKIKPDVQGDRAYFDVTVSVKAQINEQHQELTERELVQLAGQKIEEQIRSTYRKAYERNVDIYNLGESLFRRNPATFHRLTDGNRFILHQDALRNVKVTVRLSSTGRYKFQPGMSDSGTNP
ncbi:Ger(x)C family spore germination protein [Paenibacillus thermoaerophilus]|uniref:Ger(X)C family spore germination protein n=1 Tax=Paenibacillus thermoaerophilus TaxID=1215385 RepID=A0ABW2UYK8_9BACL|nr:Ger(x)C family spore germination protein [Paenibacillus thermoaerophilus]TMV10411.1 Ger(x)C family spore germination protein [Paenibacillus thermoaerophilus]